MEGVGVRCCAMERGNLAAKNREKSQKRGGKCKNKTPFYNFVIIILIFYRDLSLMGL